MPYTTCRTLPIHNFNEIQTTGDLSFLLKKKEKAPDREILYDIWLDIIGEYQSYFNSEMKIFREINAIVLENTLGLFELANSMKLLSYDTFKIMISELDITEDKFEARLKTLRNRYNSEIGNRKSTENQNNFSNFEEILAILNENGFSINRFKTPVSEYAACINRLEERSKRISSGRTN